MSRSLASCLVLALALPSAALAQDAPVIMRAASGMLAAPIIPGGSVVSAHYNPGANGWIPVDLWADAEVIGLEPLALAHDRTFDYELWDQPVVVELVSSACVFGGGGSSTGAADSCWIETEDGEIPDEAGQVLDYGLEPGETVLAVTTFQLYPSLGHLGLALVVETDQGTELRLQAYREDDFNWVSRYVLDTPEGMGTDVEVAAWSHDGVPRVAIMDDSTWWVSEDPLGYSVQHAWVKPCPSHVMAYNLPSTMRVTQLEGDTAGTQRVSWQDDDQLRWVEFGDPDVITAEGAIDIPGPEGVVASELDADLGLYTITWLSDMGEWGANLVGGGKIYGSVSFGDADLTVTSKGIISNAQDIDSTATPDTFYAIGGNAFLDGDPDRPVIAGSTGLTLEASYDAAMSLRAGPSGTTDRVLAAGTAAGQILVEKGDIAPALEVYGSQALAVISGNDRKIDAQVMFDSYWSDPDDIPGLAHFVKQAEKLLGTNIGEALDAAAVMEPVQMTGDAALSAMGRDGYIWGASEAFTDDEELIDFLIDYPSGIKASMSFSDYGGNGDQVDVVARAFSGGTLGNYDRRNNFSGGTLGNYDRKDNFTSSDYSKTTATVVLGPDNPDGTASDENSWSIVSTDPDTPLYDSVRSAMYPMCGGYCYLAGVEATSLATRGELTAVYTVNSVIAAGNSGSTLGYDNARGTIAWVSEKGGLSLTGNGELDLTVTAIDDLTGDRTVIFSNSFQWLPEIDDEVVVAIIDSGYDGGHEDLDNKLTTGTWDDEFSLELVYTLRSTDGELVTLENAVGFGFSVDSDGDGLFDDDEVGLYGTNPKLSDTDGDGVDDGDDPNPAEPGVGSDWLADWSWALAAEIECLDLSLVDAKNDNAASGRLGSMATRAGNAAESFEDGKISSATALLDGLLDRVDGADSPEDWLVDSDERVALAEDLMLMLELAEYE